MSQYTCPVCGARAQIKFRDWVGLKHRKGAGNKVLICDNYPKCDTYVGIHRHTMEPLGRMADSHTRFLRYRAHTLMDAIFEDRRIGYSQLERHFKFKPDQLHFGELYGSDLERIVKYLEYRHAKSSSQDGAGGSPQ